MPCRLTDAQRARLAERSVIRQDNFGDVDLPRLPEIPGMSSVAEGRYLYWLTSRGYTGCGAVVEIGPWLGRSTVHLAAGLRDAGHHDVLHTFDRFVWDASHAAKLKRKGASLPLVPGDDFRPVLERNVRAVYPGLHVHRSEIRELVWDGGPVEILFLDAPKRLPQISATLAAFGPSLIPGVSVIAMQDYQHFPSYALATVMSTLDDRVELMHVVDEGSIVTLGVRAPLDLQNAQPLDFNFKTWSKERALAVWARILEPLNPAARERLEPGITMLLHDLGAVDEACRIVRELQARRPMTQRWQKHAGTSLYDRYRPLFEAAGCEPGPGRGGADTGRGKEGPQTRVGRGRAAYLKSRSVARRFLEMMGIWEPRAAVAARPRDQEG